MMMMMTIMTMTVIMIIREYVKEKEQMLKQRQWNCNKGPCGWFGPSAPACEMLTDSTTFLQHLPAADAYMKNLRLVFKGICRWFKTQKARKKNPP